MTHKEALSKLELEEGATSSEISSQYQEFYNEFQMRITNAPTEHQRTLYKKKLDELTLAFETLGGKEESTEELPGIAESLPEKTEPKVATPVVDKPKMTKEKALQILGLGEKFTAKELENAFKSKVSSCETGRDNAINVSIRNAYEEAIIECNSAYKLLKEYIFIAPPITKLETPIPQVSKDSSASKKKRLLPVSIVSGLIIVVILFFAFRNGRSSTDELIDPANHDEYVSLKSQADLLAKQGNWQEALAKYESAYLVLEEAEIKDSIESMQNQLLLVSVENNDVVDEEKEEANADKEKDAAVTKKEKELEARENALKEAERLRQEKEAERLRQEKESKRIKIGDKYAGGIVFKIDAGGEHGLVCAPTDQGSKITPNEAKNVCLNLTLNGYSDWYLPSKYELNLIYINIGRGSSNGNIGKGISIGNNGWTYWSSTEGSVTYQAWEQSFWDGNQHENYTGNCHDRCFRAIRAF